MEILIEARNILAKWDGGVIVCLIVALVGFYIKGRAIRKKYRPNEKFPWAWMTPNNLTPFATSWRLQLAAGGFHTSWIMLFSAALVLTYQLVFPSEANLHSITKIAFEFPGAFFVFITGVFSATSVINTICLLHRREFQISSFKQISEVIDFFIAERVQPSKETQRQETYFIDYVPAIGALSEPKAFERITKKLKGWIQEDTSITHCIFLAPAKFSSIELHEKGLIINTVDIGPMERVVEEMVRRVKPSLTTEKYRFMMEQSLGACDRWESKDTAIWFAESVNFEHYIVGIESALLYFVIPDEAENETRNQITGSLHTDAMHVTYLRDVCRTYLRQAITPHQATTRKVSRENREVWETRLQFRVTQPHMAAIRVEFFDENKKTLRGVPAEVKYAESVLSEISSFSTTKKPSWLKTEIIKKPDTGTAAQIVSPQSFFVRIDEVQTE